MEQKQDSCSGGKRGISYGMPSLLECSGPEENARLCMELGFSFVELNMNLPSYLPGRLNLMELRRIQERTGVRFTFHLPEAMNPFDFDPAVASAYEGQLLQTLRAVKALSEPDELALVNLHLPEGVYFSMPDRRVYLMERYQSEFYASLCGVLEKCEREAGGRVVVCVENCEGFSPWQREALCFLLESPTFALTWDVGHDNFAGGADRPFLLQHMDRIRHMHLHDGNGPEKSPHLPLGAGKIDLPDRFRFAAEHGCTCVIEVKTADALRQSAEWMRQNGFLESPNYFSAMEKREE